MEDFELNILALSTHFLRKGYPIDLILEAALKARRLDREEILEPQEGDSHLIATECFLSQPITPMTKLHVTSCGRIGTFWDREGLNSHRRLKQEETDSRVQET